MHVLKPGKPFFSEAVTHENERDSLEYPQRKSGLGPYNLVFLVGKH